MTFVDVTAQFERKGALLPEDQVNEKPGYPFDDIFTDFIYRQTPIDTSKHPVSQILNYKARKKYDQSDHERIKRLVGPAIKFFRWDDFPSEGAKHPRFFGVYITPLLKLKIDRKGLRNLPVHVYLHPIGDIHKHEKKYYLPSQSIDEYYRDVGIHYMLNDQRLAHCHRYSVRKESDLNDPAPHMPICIVFPIFSGSAHTSFPHYKGFHFIEVLESLISNALPRFFDPGRFNPGYFSLGRLAFSAFSAGGDLLNRLFNTSRKELLEKINEVYTFDITLGDLSDRFAENTKFWNSLKKWQGDNSSRLIRIYSADTGNLSQITAELKENLRKYGGGTHIAAKFTEYNGKIIDNRLVSNLSDGLELHSTDNSRILFFFPMINFEQYYAKIANPNGIGGIWIGHSWFSRALVSHALFHSGFKQKPS